MYGLLAVQCDGGKVQQEKGWGAGWGDALGLLHSLTGKAI